MGRREQQQSNLCWSYFGRRWSYRPRVHHHRAAGSERSDEQPGDAGLYRQFDVPRPGSVRSSISGRLPRPFRRWRRRCITLPAGTRSLVRPPALRRPDVFPRQAGQRSRWRSLYHYARQPTALTEARDSPIQPGRQHSSTSVRYRLQQDLGNRRSTSSTRIIGATSSGLTATSTSRTTALSAASATTSGYRL